MAWYVAFNSMFRKIYFMIESSHTFFAYLGLSGLSDIQIHHVAIYI